MSKNDFYYNNEKIINNYIEKNKYIEKSNDKIYNIKYDKYYKIDKFLDLFSVSSNASSLSSGTSFGSRTNNQQIQTSIPSNSIINGQQNQNTTTPVADDKDKTESSDNDVQLQGRTYNSNVMWSPQSLNGRVYEWNRGVIGIGLDGTLKKENLDGTSNHHADATVRIVKSLGGNIPYTGMPFADAIEGTKEGFIIFQSEGDKAFVYLPEKLTEEQRVGLESVISPRDSFNFSFTHGGQIYEEQRANALLNFSSNLVEARGFGR